TLLEDELPLLNAPQAVGPVQAAPELKRVRFLLALDTASNLVDQLVLDEDRMVRLLRGGIPPARLHLNVLKGSQLTRANVLAYSRTLKPGPDEALVFFYGGQGAISPRRGPFLQLQNGRRSEELVRSELRQAMLAKKAGLTVILTECCGVFPAVGGPAGRP